MTFWVDRGTVFDLVRERPGSLLFWLNRQPHLRRPAMYLWCGMKTSPGLAIWWFRSGVRI